MKLDMLSDLRFAARDSGVVDHHIPAGPGTRYLVSDFEDTVTELGWRVLYYDLDENEWGVWPPRKDPQ